MTERASRALCARAHMAMRWPCLDRKRLGGAVLLLAVRGLHQAVNFRIAVDLEQILKAGLAPRPHWELGASKPG